MNQQKLIAVLKEKESIEIRAERLAKSLDRLQSRYNDTERDLTMSKNKYSFLQDQFREVAKNCFPREYISEDLGAKTEGELYEYIVKKVSDIQQELFYTGLVKEEYEEKLELLEGEVEKLKSVGPIAQSGEEDSPAAEPEEFEEGESFFDAIQEELTDSDYQYVGVVGGGVNLFSEIVKETGDSNGKGSRVLKELVEKGILSFEKIQKGGKGRPSHNYFLTNIGVEVYQNRYGQEPEVTILEKMSTHGSAHHGGLIVEVGEFLKENGCDVYYDGPDTTYPLKSGRNIIFDIKAFDKETKELLVVETERARCGESHLFEKYDKCLEFVDKGLTKTIHIVSPDRDSLHKIQQSLFKWVKKQDRKFVVLNQDNKERAIIVFKTATLEEFKKGEFQMFHYGLG